MSTLDERREADEVLAPDLRRIGRHHNVIGAGDHRPLDGGLVTVRGGQAVPDADAVGADECDVDAQGVQHAEHLLADGGLGEATDPAAEQLQGHRRHAGQPRGDGDRVRDDRQLTVGRQRGRYPAGGGPGVEQHAGPAEREELGRGRGDGVLVFGAGVLAFTDAGLDEPQGPHGNGAAVHPPHQPGAVQDGQVAADRLGGDVVGLGQFGHRGATLADHQRGDRLLTLFGVHGAPFVWY